MTAPAEPRRAIPPRLRRCMAEASAMGAPVAGPGWACNSGQAILAPLLAATLGHNLSHAARHDSVTAARECAVVARTRSRDDNSLSTPPPLDALLDDPDPRPAHKPILQSVPLRAG